MVIACLILMMGLLPLLISWWGLHQVAIRRTQQRRLLVRHSPSFLRTNPFFAEGTLAYGRALGVDAYIGDTSCCYNAHSTYLRCAVNPAGPCQSCAFYEPLSYLASAPHDAPTDEWLI